jgi:hypothetical protein
LTFDTKQTLTSRDHKHAATRKPALKTATIYIDPEEVHRNDNVPFLQAEAILKSIGTTREEIMELAKGAKR